MGIRDAYGAAPLDGPGGRYRRGAGANRPASRSRPSVLPADFAGLGEEVDGAGDGRASTASSGTSWTASSCPTSRSAPT